MTTPPRPNPELDLAKARAAFASLVMQALGQEYERAGEQLADRMLETLSKYGGLMQDEDPAKRLQALGAAVADSCKATLGLLSAAAGARRSK